MDDVLPVLAVLGLGVVLLALVRSRFTRPEQGLIGLCFLAHVLAALAQVWITRGVYGGGDMFMYHASGELLSRLMRSDPGRFVPEVIALVFRERPMLPVRVLGVGSATGSMIGISGFLSLLTGGSVYAMGMIIALGTFVSQIALYRVFRETFSRSYHIPILAATTLIPSAVFWSSGLLKESVALVGFGWMVLGAHRLLHGRWVTGGTMVILGVAPVLAVKPYIAVAVVLASAVWVYWKRTGGAAVRPVYIAIGSLLTVGVLLGIGQVFPAYSIEQFAEDASTLQKIGSRISGGSNYSLGVPASAGFIGQLFRAPLALLTTLFRPFVFEVTSATMAVNAVEMLALTVLMIRGIKRHGFRGAWRIVSASPLLMFCLAFTVFFGVAVGLASTNLGSLSRYRTPLIPLLTALVTIWNVAAPRRAKVSPARRAFTRRAPLRRVAP